MFFPRWIISTFSSSSSDIIVKIIFKNEDFNFCFKSGFEQKENDLIKKTI